MKLADMCPRTLRRLADDLDGQVEYAELTIKHMAGNARMEAFWDGIAKRAKTNARDYRRKAAKAELAQQKKGGAV